MIVVFGSEPDAFYIGYGRRWSANKMPPALMDQIQTSVLSPFSASWLSCSSDCQQFIYRNWVTDASEHFSLNLKRCLGGCLQETSWL